MAFPYKKKPSSNPMFAEVKVAGNENRHSSSPFDTQRRENCIPYIKKLSYPSGVALCQLASLDIKTIEQYIRITVWFSSLPMF